MKLVKCKKCNGSGSNLVPCGPGPFGEQTWANLQCTSCHGKGKMRPEFRTEEQIEDDEDGLRTVLREYGIYD